MNAYALEVVQEGRGARLVRLVQDTFAGKVQHVERIELLVLPRGQYEMQRLALIGQLRDGETVVMETTLELFRAACHQLEEH